MRNLFLFTLFFCQFASALDFNGIKGISVSGFGTLGLSDVRSNHRYLSEFQSSGNDLNYLTNSNLGLNVTSRINDRTRVVIQSIMLGASDNFAPQIDVASFSIEVAQNLELFAGRMVAPIWMYSEEQSIGYSYIWLKPPQQLYSQVPFRDIDGFGFRYNHSFGPMVAKAQVLGGRGRYRDTDNPTGYNVRTSIDIRDALSAELRLERDERFGIRLGFSQANAVVASNVEQLGTPNVSQTQINAINNAKLYSLGVRGQLAHVLTVAEVMQIESSSDTLKKIRGGYATVGYQIHSWMPHFTGAWNKDAEGPFFQTSERDGYFRGSDSFTLGLNFSGLDNVVLKAGISKTTEHFTGRADNPYFVYSVLGSFIF